MEKLTPHYKLSHIKALIDLGQVRATFSAITGAAALGMDFNDMLKTIMALTASDFYKSMTTRSDHRIWHDVYKKRALSHDIYLKLTVIDGILIVSFKEK